MQVSADIQGHVDEFNRLAESLAKANENIREGWFESAESALRRARSDYYRNVSIC